MFKMVDVKDYNVLILGLSFMFISSAFQTTSIIEESILKSAKNESHSGEFKASGYNSLFVVYISVAIFNWFAPPIIALIGTKYTMMLGGICYCTFITGLFFVSKYVDHDLSVLLFVVSAVNGFGYGVLYTAQGACLTVNSTDETMGRNSGIIWTFLQCSILIGSFIVYFCFKPKNGSIVISLHQRSTVLITLLCLAAFGTIFLLLLQKIRCKEEVESRENLLVNNHRQRDNNQRVATSSSPWESFLGCLRLLFTKPMFFFNIVFFYSGLELSFIIGVYGTCIGNTLQFSDSKRLIGLSGIFLGIGDIFGGGIFGIFGKRITEKGRDSVVLLGMLIQYVAFYLILLNLPEKSPTDASYDMGYINKPSISLAMFCSFLLGVGDSCYNTQIFSILGNFYSDKSASAFAIYTFFQSLGLAVAFFYSDHLGLRPQLYILIMMAFLATLSFFIVERMAKLKARAQI